MKTKVLRYFLYCLPLLLLLLMYPSFAQDRRGATFIHCQHSVTGEGMEVKCTPTPQKPVIYAKTGKSMTCKDCHAEEKISEKWRAGHRPCVECHKTDFLKADATICYNCHLSNDPSQQKSKKTLKLKPLPNAKSTPDKRVK